MGKHTQHAPPAKVEPKAPPAGEPTSSPTQPPVTPAVTETPKPTPKGKPKAVPALSIRSIPQSGFCRAGRRWVPTPQVIPVSEFTDEQIEALRAEPLLVVEDAETEPETGAEV